MPAPTAASSSSAISIPVATAATPSSVGDIGGGYGECGPVSIDGGTVDNSTNLNIDAGGGVAIGDASGGSGNLGASDDGYMVSSGNGGVAGTTANGGIVVIENINSGGNSGNCHRGRRHLLCRRRFGGGVSIDGGTVDNSTTINIDASGGTAIADASGGDDNLAAASGDDDDGRRVGDQFAAATASAGVALRRRRRVGRKRWPRQRQRGRRHCRHRRDQLRR